MIDPPKKFHAKPLAASFFVRLRERLRSSKKDQGAGSGKQKKKSTSVMSQLEEL